MIQNHRNKMMKAAALERLAAMIEANAVLGNHGVYGIRFHVRDGSIMEIEKEVKENWRPKTEEFPQHGEKCGSA